MTIGEYLDIVKERILFDPVINEFHVIRERMTATDGYLRVKMLLVDGGMIECADYGLSEKVGRGLFKISKFYKQA